MIRRPTQTSFFKPAPKYFGGTNLKGNPRGKRPISITKPTHLVMRSKHARRDWSFLHKNNRKNVDGIITAQAKKLGIKIYGYSNSGNHLHLNVLFPSLRAYRVFIRAISGLIARAVMGCE